MDKKERERLTKLQKRIKEQMHKGSKEFAKFQGVLEKETDPKRISLMIQRKNLIASYLNYMSGANDFLNWYLGVKGAKFDIREFPESEDDSFTKIVN